MTMMLRRAHLLGDGGGVEPEPARALEDDRVADPDPHPVEPVEDLGERAVDRGGDVVGDAVRHLVDEVAGAQVEVLAVRADEVRRVVGVPRPAPLVGARRPVPVEAGGAAAARVEVAVGDPVALLERGAGRVGRDVPPEPLDHAAHLVAEGLAAVRRPDQVLELAAPDVEVRPADPAAGDPHQGGIRLDLRDGVLPDVEVGAELRHDGEAAFHARALLVGGSVGLAGLQLLHEVRLGGGDPGSEGHRHAEALEGHLHAGQPGEELQLVQAAEVADPEHLALDVAEPDAEREVERPVGVGDVGVRVEAGRHDHGGQRVRVLAGLPAEDPEPERRGRRGGTPRRGARGAEDLRTGPSSCSIAIDSRRPKRSAVAGV